MKPVRIQRSRQHKQVSPNGLPIVYVGRGSKWGNPFVVGKRVHETWFEAFETADRKLYFDGEDGAIVSGNREAVRLFARYVTFSLEGDDVKLLKGKNLSCWCKRGQVCHANVLLKIANEEEFNIEDFAYNDSGDVSNDFNVYGED